MAKVKLLDEMSFDGWDQLDALIVWASQEYCAEKLNVSVDTLARRLKEEGYSFAEYKYKKKESLRINLLKKQYDVAMAGNVSMLIWLGKNELGQKDKLESDISVADLKILINKEEIEL